jgi:hypothetical protein
LLKGSGSFPLNKTSLRSQQLPIKTPAYQSFGLKITNHVFLQLDHSKSSAVWIPWNPYTWPKEEETTCLDRSPFIAINCYLTIYRDKRITHYQLYGRILVALNLATYKDSLRLSCRNDTLAWILLVDSEISELISSSLQTTLNGQNPFIEQVDFS